MKLLNRTVPFWIAFCTSLVAAVTASSHPCSRPCVQGAEPMRCEYNFTVEWYRTLSKACWDCPFIQSDCFRPQCVSGDGKFRPVIAVNRQIPAPPIEVCENDQVVVWVKNMLSDGATTSLHWHGLHQRGTPYMDGAAHLTQCPIQPLESFRYDFVAYPAGTHWYHSHSGLQMGDGMAGAFIVRQTEEADPNSPLYDYDLSEHVIIINDWMPETSHDRFMKLMHDAYTITDMSALINGRADLFEVQNERNYSGSPLTSARTPVSVFHVQPGRRYRFRLISASQKCPFRVFFDYHALQIIATDGMPVSPVTVDSIMMGPGERYDVVISTDHHVDNYWIRANGLRDCWYTDGTVTAILRYEGANETRPERDQFVYLNGTLFAPLEDATRPVYYGDGYPTMPLTTLNYTSMQGDVVNFTGQEPDVRHYIEISFLNNDNSRFNDEEFYNVKSLPLLRSHFTPTMNNITFHLPPVPLMSQPEDVEESWFCNASSIDHSQCQLDLCQCTHRIKFRTGQYEAPFTSEHIRKMEAAGNLTRKLINPPIKDTLFIPSKHYAIIRFLADNPGIWFFHCHIETHLAQGKAMLIQDGDYADFPPLPEEFPRCGGFGTSNAKRTSRPAPPPQNNGNCQGNTNFATASHYSVFLLLLALWWHLMFV